MAAGLISSGACASLSLLLQLQESGELGRNGASGPVDESVRWKSEREVVFMEGETR
uniref:Uncharacterized protein n=1 Tax=Arundo donax TaxID=35708 RepID=A0A0A9FAH2_ARUDO